MATERSRETISVESSRGALHRGDLLEFRLTPCEGMSASDVRDWMERLLDTYGDIPVSFMMPLDVNGEWVSLPIHGTWLHDPVLEKDRIYSDEERLRQPDIGLVGRLPLRFVLNKADSLQHGGRLLLELDASASVN